MVKKTTLESLGEKFLASKFISSITNVVKERFKNRYEKLGSKIGEQLKEGKKLSEESILILSLEWSDEAPSWARKLNLALEEFKQINPKAYEQFEEIRSKHRNVRRDYIRFGGEVSEDVYIGIIRDILKVDDYNAHRIYNSIIGLDEIICRKKRKGDDKYLLPE